jgi:hypothetical protein
MPNRPVSKDSPKALPAHTHFKSAWLPCSLLLPKKGIFTNKAVMSFRIKRIQNHVELAVIPTLAAAPPSIGGLSQTTLNVFTNKAVMCLGINAIQNNVEFPAFQEKAAPSVSPRQAAEG